MHFFTFFALSKIELEAAKREICVGQLREKKLGEQFKVLQQERKMEREEVSFIDVSKNYWETIFMFFQRLNITKYHTWSNYRIFSVGRAKEISNGDKGMCHTSRDLMSEGSLNHNCLEKSDIQSSMNLSQEDDPKTRLIKLRRNGQIK